VGGNGGAAGPIDGCIVDPLKVFQSIGHFLPLAHRPATALSYIAKQLSLAAPLSTELVQRRHRFAGLGPASDTASSFAKVRGWSLLREGAQAFCEIFCGEVTLGAHEGVRQ